MRALLAVAAVLLILALVGWISFSSDDSRSSINLETEEIKQDTREALESSADLLKDAEKSVKNPGDAPHRPIEN
jgi:hypothetical protein